MTRKALTVATSAGAVCFGLASVPAVAADIGVYYPAAPPPIESPFYTPMVQAHVDLYGGKVFFSYDDDDSESAGLFGGAGRINVPFQNGWNFQMDAQGSALLWHEDGNSYSTATEFSGYGHVYRKVPDSHAVGVFGGASWMFGPQAYTLGVEGQMYWPQFTLYGQASVSALRAGDESGHALQLRGQGQWFATDNTAFMGDVIWTSVNHEYLSASVLSLAGTVMHRFDGTPFAGFGKVRWDHSSLDGYTANATTALLGVRVMTGMPGSTLKQALREVPMNVEPILFGDFGPS